MIDYTELKRLAEACGDLNWRAIQENWCEWAVRDDHAYIANMRTKSAKHAGPCPERETKAKFLCAVTPSVVLALIAENESLRDDLEQIKYDANAWRNSEESVWIEVFNSEGDDPFISAISGQIAIEQLVLIQAQLIEYRDDYFEKGSGLYVFRCAHYQAHYDNVGMTEPAHWETDFELYSAFPWEEEADAMDKEHQQ